MSVEQIFAVILGFGCLQGFILAFVLLQKRLSSCIANRFLAAFILVFTIFLLDATASLLPSLYMKVLPFFAIHYPLEFTIGPLIYFYVKSLTQQMTWQKKHWLHFLPAIVAVFIYSPVYLLSAEQKTRFFNEMLNLIPMSSMTNSELYWAYMAIIYAPFFAIIQLLIYFVISYKTTSTYSRSIRHHYSTIDQLRIDWLKQILVLLSLLYIIYTLIIFSYHLELVQLAIIWYYTPLIVMSIVVISIGYIGLMRNDVISGALTEAWRETPASIITSINEPEKEKYQTSALTAEKALEYKDRIINEITANKPYLDSELTASKLAKSVNITPNYLSEILSTYIEQNFYDFINQYRIEEAKSRLIDSQYKTTPIIELAMEIGFNSKSSFYNAFKKYTGLTPSQYKKKNP